MKKIIFALLCAFFAQASFADQLATDKKIYRDTVIWPILQQIILCRPGVTGGLPANATQAQIDACWANMQGRGFRFPTLQAVKDESARSTTMHAQLARGVWKIKTAQTPEEFPIWKFRCGVFDGTKGNPVVTTFEQCEAVVNKWTNADSKAVWLSRSYVVDENGNWVDHRAAYTIQPGWAKKLGHTNPRFATNLWNSRLATLKAKLAAAAP